MTRRIVFCWFCICASAGGAGCRPTAQTITPTGPPVTSADDLVRQVARFYESVHTVHVVVDQSVRQGDESVRQGDSQSSAVHSVELWVRRPSELASRDAGGTAVELMNNRRSHFVVNRSQQTYIEGKSWGDLDRLSMNPAPIAAGGWGVMFGPVLVCDDPYRAIMSGVDVIEYLGQENLDGAEVHHILLEQSNLKWEMWIAAEGDPLVVQLEFDRAPTAVSQANDNAKYRVHFRSWRLNQPIPDETFHFEPPASFQRTSEEMTPEVDEEKNKEAELEAVRERGGEFSLQLEWLDWGMRHWEQHQRVVPGDFLEVLRPFDAILLGAVGWPALVPDHLSLAPLVQIRQAFDQYACLRPARLLPGVKSVLAGKGPRDIDFVVIRENSEGEYVDNGGRVRRGHPDEVAVQTAIHTRRGVERILRFGFEVARTRRHQLTMATKSNAQRYAYVLWDEVLEELSPQYSDVRAERQHCDALIMNLVRCPERFDVLVASNLFGDLLTDLGGILAGGLGLAPSTNTNPERRFPSMFEPVHGSAPDIAGQGLANPIAAILSAAMMMDHLRLPTVAQRIRAAVELALAEGHRTPDLGGRLSTRQMGQSVVAALEGTHVAWT